MPSTPHLPLHPVVAAVALATGLMAAAQSPATDGFVLSGTQRTRYETLAHQFRADLDSGDRALALQTSVNLDWHRDNLQIFGEIMDSRVGLNDAQSYLSTSLVNTVEPVQAFVAWRHEGAQGGRGTLRAGRMTIDVGKRRLIARSRFRNTVDSFTGLDWDWHGADQQALRAFFFVPMTTLPGDDPALLDDEHELDRGMRRNELFGLYYQPAPFAHERTLEVYAFEHRLRPTSDPLFESDMAVDHVTLGTRLYRSAKPGNVNYELEAALQRGTSGNEVNSVTRYDLRHRAHFLHLEIGYQLEGPWAANIVLQYDLASGDENPFDARNERFDTLFGDRSFEFGPTGIWGLMTRANVRSPGVRATFRPKPRWRGVLAYRRVSLDEPTDEWASSDYRDETGSNARSVGAHLEASFTWTAIEDRLTIETGVAQLAARSYVRTTAGAAFTGNPQYFYLAATTNF